MLTDAVRARLAQDLGGWLADGVVSHEVHELLRQRYASRALGAAQAVKSLGIAGGMLAFFGLLGLAAALADSLAVGALLLLAVGAGLATAGVRLSLAPTADRDLSAAVVLALGVACGTLGLGALLTAVGVDRLAVVPYTGTLALPLLTWMAYRYVNVPVLVMALLGLFHWLGSWTDMLGRATYAIGLEDPRLVALAALVVVAVGIVHERHLRPRTGRFYQAYQAVGLSYFNLTLLTMSDFDGPTWGARGPWMAVLTVAAAAQIVAGTRLHSRLLTTFGATALAVDAFTRYYDWLGSRLSLGALLLLGGSVLFGAGAACEAALRRRGATAL